MELTAEAREGLDEDVLAYINSLESRNEQLLEELRIALYRKFGRSSEIDRNEPQLFDESETESANAEDSSEPEYEETVEVAAHTKKKPGRKPIDDSLPRVEIRHDIEDSDKRCGCGSELVCIGEETSERLQVIPEQVWVERHVRPKYACHKCEGSGDEDRPAVRIARPAPSLIPGSIATAGLLAFIIVNKFCDHLPFYRQEKRFERIGVHISRQVMSGWVMAVAKRLSPLVELIAKGIREGPRINMDETRMQVLGEPGKENTSDSYMWLAFGGEPDVPLCLYHYSPSRSAEYPRSFLAEYEGAVQADAFGVYARIACEYPDIVLVGCWAHARRKFHEAAQAGKKTAAAREAVARIKKLYSIETQLRAKELSSHDFITERRKQVEPELRKFRQWLENKREQVLPSSLLGKAVKYTLDQWEPLTRYLDYAELTPDNNIAERSIRPFVVGRKNWLTSGSPRGAEASCALYSLIQTAQLNGLNPFAYLHHVFTQVANSCGTPDWEALLPTNLDAESINSGFPATVR